MSTSVSPSAGIRTDAPSSAGGNLVKRAFRKPESTRWAAATLSVEPPSRAQVSGESALGTWVLSEEYGEVGGEDRAGMGVMVSTVVADGHGGSS